ncbi:Lrp/AsnC family transcriptional regulator [Granulicoccus sp. GXG6511]|uniref:Lrp/AsnC family transcriptional regulator n=1 Tax=Granulicoccus sp. GXG6511 TaxID=3381351 RepID=UPI003D7C98E7
MSSGRIALDDVDRRILRELQADGRLSVNELASRANVSRATAYARLDRLRREGAITGYTVVIDPAAVGLGVAAIVLVNVRQRTWEESAAELGGLPGVERVLLTSGQFDFALLVRVGDIADLRDVLLGRLQTMPFVTGSQTIFVLDEHDNGLDLSLLD